MTPFLSGFTDELTKVAVVGGLAKRLGKTPGWIAKNPRKAIYGLLATGVVAGAGAEAVRGHRRGRAGGRGRYLHAGVGPTGKVSPSAAAYYNFSKHFPRTRSKRQREAATKHYKRKTFRS